MSGTEPQWNDRQQQLLARLQLEGEVKVAELREQFGVTEMTVRRDLEKLELAGLARRTFGGAIAISRDVALRERTNVLLEEKARIGKEAALFIREGDSVFIDGGTTTLQVARALPRGLAVTVVTNALNIALELMEKGIQTHVTGGAVLETTSTLVGPTAVESLGRMAFDRVFLGATGVSARHGFSNSNLHEAEVKRRAIAQATEVNILVDHTKFGAKELFSFAALSQASRLLTDREPEAELLQACREAGQDVRVCR
jgi:DeoR/GlpR family transcriptional regulator of sugar metabolism